MYSYEEENEYQELLSICRDRRISSPAALTRYITNNRMDRRFPRLAGDVDFSNGNTLRNGIAPKYYRRLCRDLDFNNPFKKKISVTGFTPNYRKYNNYY